MIKWIKGLFRREEKLQEPAFPQKQRQALLDFIFIAEEDNKYEDGIYLKVEK